MKFGNFNSLINKGFILVMLLSGWFLYQSFGIKLDFDFERFFPVESDDAEFYYAFRERFGSDSDFLIAAVKNSEGVFEPSFLDKADTLAKHIGSIDGVSRVVALNTLKVPIIHSMGFAEIPLLNRTSEETIRRDSALLMKNIQYKGVLFSPDAQWLAVVVRHQLLRDKEKADVLLQKIETELELAQFEETRLSGKILWERNFLERTRQEVILFMICSAVLVIFFLWFIFRNIWGIVIPLLVVLLSIIWTTGFMVMTGKSLDLMVILVPCILFVVGMSDVIHIASQFYEKTAEGYSRERAVKSAVEEVGFATFLTCISTSVAFLTLNTTSIQPVRDFGTYTAFGIVSAYIISITLLPWILLRVKNPERFRMRKLKSKWDGLLRDQLYRVFRRPRLIVLSCMAILLVAGAGIQKIHINNSVLDDLDPSDPIRENLRFFDANFTGMRGFELAITAKEPYALLDWEVLQELEALGRYLRDSIGVHNIISPLEVVKGFNQALHNAEPEMFVMPTSRDEYEELKRKLLKYVNKKEIRAVIASGLKDGRLTGFLKDKGSYNVDAKNKKVKAFLETGAGTFDYRITGSADLIDKSNQYLTENMLEGLSMDILVLMLVIGLLFRSWRMMLISVLPNILPLVAIAGLMGWAGIEMKVTISVIFSIAFGIAVDDTLHLLSRLKVELNKGSTLPRALRTTYLSTGKAMILTTLVIAVGFSTLMLSSFKSTFYMGMMISLTLLIALLAELFLMPVLILSLYGKHYQKKSKLQKNKTITAETLK